MSDISMVIEELKHGKMFGNITFQMPYDEEEIDTIIGTLEKQLNDGWIPVSERLPDICGLGLLLTIENRYEQRKVIKGFTGYMEKGKLEFHTNDKETDLKCWKVLAWQSLPEPYKEDI